MANYDDIFSAPMETDNAPQLSKEEYAAKKKAERDEIYALADQTATEIFENGETFRCFLDVQAQFHRYTVANALLIYAQNPEATFLREYDDWEKRGTPVRRHESSISILEPGDTYTTPEGRIGTYYNVKKVFDIAQTRRRNPAVTTPVHYDDHFLLSALIAKRPVPIETVDELQNGAVYDHSQGKIYVRRGMEAADIFRSVSLALARAEIARNGKEYDPNKAAFQSYCVSYMLGRRYGIDVSGYSFDQLPENLRSADPQTIRSELTEIRDTLTTMTSKMAKAMEQTRSRENKEQER